MFSFHPCGFEYVLIHFNAFIYQIKQINWLIGTPKDSAASLS